MKKCDVFTRCVNLFALSGYLLSIMSLLDHESARTYLQLITAFGHNDV